MREVENNAPISSEIKTYENITEFLEEVRTLDKQKLLPHLIQFASFINQNGALQLLSKEDNPKKAFRSLFLYYHPDKYNHYIGITEEQKGILEDAWKEFIAARAELIQKSENSFEEIQSFVSEIFTVDAAMEKRIESLMQIEKDCFAKIRAHGDVLHPDIVISLLRIYGQTISYLINWSAENNLNWLTSEGNMVQLGKNLSILMPYLEKFELVKEFDNALQISSLVDKSREQKKLLQNITDKVVSRNQEEKSKEKKSTYIEGGSTVLGVVASISLAAALVSNPIGWGVTFASSILIIGSFIASTAHKNSRYKDRLNFYETLFKTINTNYQQMTQIIGEHLEYLNTISIAKLNMHYIQSEIKSSVQKDLLSLQALGAERNKTENELLRFLEKEYNNQKQIEFKKTNYFSAEEKRKLSVLVMDDLDNLSSERERELREHYLSVTLSENDLVEMEKAKKNPIRPKNQLQFFPRPAITLNTNSLTLEEVASVQAFSSPVTFLSYTGPASSSAYFSQEEIRKLSILVCDDLSCLTPERAKELRENYLTIDIPEEELAMMREALTSSSPPSSSSLLVDPDIFNLSASQSASEESKESPKSKEKIGPIKIPGWELQNVESRGNCFYDAVICQLELLNHPFFAEVQEGTSPRDVLRLRIQGRDFKDGEWADYAEVMKLARQFDFIIAIVDTRAPELDYVYHYELNGQDFHTNDSATLPKGRSIVQLAFTGNHYLSVTRAPQKLQRSTPTSQTNGDEAREVENTTRMVLPNSMGSPS